MESKHHAVNSRPQPLPPLSPQPPHTSNPPFATPYFSERPMEGAGGFTRMVPPMMCPVTYIPQPPQPPLSQHTLYLPSAIAYFSEPPVGGAGSSTRMVPWMMRASEALQRELEKEQIRREMITEEMKRERRRELEMEVRRELMLERHMSLGQPARLAFQERMNPQLDSAVIKDLPQPYIMDPAKIKPDNKQDDMQERVNLRSNSIGIKDLPQPRIMHPAEINSKNKQDDMQEQVNRGSYSVAIKDLPHLHIMGYAGLKPTNREDDMQKLGNQQLNSVVIEDIPQPRTTDPNEIKQAYKQDNMHERVNVCSNSVVIEDFRQPRISDPVEFKTSNKQDDMQKRVHLRLKSGRIEDFPQPSFMDPHENKPINKHDDMQERVNMRLNYVADLPQPLIMDPTEIKLLADKQDGMQKRANMWLNPNSKQVAIFEDVRQPHIMDNPIEIKPTNNQDEFISLTKPIDSAKRKAAEPAVNDSQFSLMKKPKKEWRCALCQVTTTDENNLNEHLRGKKHKAKEAALGAEKIGFDAKADIKTHQALGGEDKTQQNVASSAVEANKEEKVVQKSQNFGVSETNEVITEEAGITNALVGRMKFWCNVCGISTLSQGEMENHKRGRKHQKRMKNIMSQNNGPECPSHIIWR